MRFFRSQKLPPFATCLIVGASTILTGCDRKPNSFSEKVSVITEKCNSGRWQEINQNDWVVYYSSLAPDSLLKLAYQQKTDYDENHPLALNQIWAMNSLLKVITFNLSENNNSNLSAPLDWENFLQKSQIVRRDNQIITAAIDENLELAKNVYTVCENYLPVGQKLSAEEYHLYFNQSDECAIENVDPVSVLQARIDEFRQALNAADADGIARTSKKLLIVMGVNMTDDNMQKIPPLDLLAMAQQKLQDLKHPAVAMLKAQSDAVNSFIVQYISGKYAQSLFELASGQKSYSSGLYSSKSGRIQELADKEADEESRRSAANQMLMNQVISNMNNAVNSFQSSSSSGK